MKKNKKKERKQHASKKKKPAALHTRMRFSKVVPKTYYYLHTLDIKKQNKQEDDFSHESKNCETTKPDINV